MPTDANHEPSAPPSAPLSCRLSPVACRLSAQERLDADRRAINRAMIDAAREREQYVARHGPACATPTPEMEAHQRLRALLAEQEPPELGYLRHLALAWLAEDRELGREQHQIDRLMRQTPRPGKAREPRVPRGYVADCPWPVTLSQGRILDLRCLGATAREIASVETISRHTVETVLKGLCARLDVPTQAQARDAWRAWCAGSGRTTDPKLQAALSLVRGQGAGGSGQEHEEIADAS